MGKEEALLFWAIAVVVFLVLEALTPQLLSIWFAAGALVALIVCALGGSFTLQLVLWVLVSAAMLAGMWPIAKRFRKGGGENLNAGRIVGRHGLVIAERGADKGSGQIRVSGAVWSAECPSQDTVAVGTWVTVEKIEGVRAIVRPSRTKKEAEKTENASEKTSI